MPTPDGSIIIDTRIDQKGVATGVKGISKALGGVLNVVKNIAKVMAAAFIGGSIINGIRSILSSLNLMESSIGEKFKSLKDAVDTLKGAFLNLILTALVPLIPYIVVAVQWLTNMLAIVTQVVAALFGMQKTIGGISGNLKKATKEAKGALAAFDQINVLQQKQEQEQPEAPSFTPPPIEIDPKIQAWIDEILEKIQTWKEILDTIFDNPLALLKVLDGLWKIFVQWVRDNLPFGDFIANILEVLGDIWKRMIINALETFLEIKKNILRVITGIKEFITGVFTGDWALAWQGLKDIVGGVFGAIFALVKGVLNHIGLIIEGNARILRIIFEPVLEWLKEKWQDVKETIVRIWGALTAWFSEHIIEPLREGFHNALEAIREKFFEILDKIKSIVGNIGAFIKEIIDNVVQPLREGFGTALEWVQDKFRDVFDNVRDFARNMVNGIIDFINSLVEGVASAINILVTGFNAVGSIVPGFVPLEYIDAPQIPRLATGAVIPPNSEFMAVLGDQRSGRNIEAPESLIRQIVREETGKMQADITIRFEGSLSQLVRELKPVIDRENVRVGGSLIKSGTIV